MKARRQVLAARLGRPRGAGFTLLELLIVLGLVAALAALFITGLAGGGTAAALEAGQATLVNLLTTARNRSMATGRRCRVLVNHEVAAAGFRRTLVLQEEAAAGEWTVRETFVLPEGVYVVPHRTRLPAGLMENAAAWRRFGQNEVLASSALSLAPVQAVVGGGEAQAWEYVQFVPAGTVGSSGDLVLGTGRVRAPGTFANGESPIVLDGPAAVRGVSLSVYGLVRPVAHHAGF